MFVSLFRSAGRALDRRRPVAVVSVSAVVALLVAGSTPASALIPIGGDGGGTTGCHVTSSGSMSASPSSIVLGQSFVLSWNALVAADCVSINIIGPGGESQPVAASGSMTLTPPLGTPSWSLRVAGMSGSRTLATKSVTVQASWPAPPAPGSGGTFSITSNNQRDLLLQAITTPGAIVNIAGNVSLDLSGWESVTIAPGVQIIGDQTQIPRGPRLFTTTFPKKLFLIGSGGPGFPSPSDNVRISGIFLDGGMPQDIFEAVGKDDSDAIVVQSSLNVEISNSRISAWRGAAVTIVDPQDRMSFANVASTVWIHDNYIHLNNHPTVDGCCTGHGAGYGVNVSHGGYALIERNSFGDNRHSITSDGTPGTGYLLYRNLILNGGGVNRRTLEFVDYTHAIDVHGTQCIAYMCGPAGEFFDVAYNTVLYTNGPGLKLRGTPADRMDVKNNVFAHKTAPKAMEQTTTGLSQSGNTFGFNPATAKLSECDFDGDRKNDSFMATGVTWWYFSSKAQRWIYLNQSSKTVGQVTLGQVNGDGRCDVTVANQVFFTPDLLAVPPAPSRQQAPDVRGMSWQAASEALTAAGFTPIVLSVENPGCSHQTGQVFDQDPPPGGVAALRSGSVTLYTALPCQG